MAIVALYNEKALLSKIAAGDQSAFTELYHHYAPEVFNAAVFYLKEPVEANEIVQDVFLKVWEKRAGVENIEHFSNYLFILVRNHIYDGFRKKAAEQTVLSHFFRAAPDMAVDNADHRLRNGQYEKLLLSAVNQLSPARKKVYLARQEGKSYQVIARELQISEATAKKQMTQARQFVQEYILEYLNIYTLIFVISRLK